MRIAIILTCLTVLTISWGTVAPAAPITLPNCLVSLIEEAQVPAEAKEGGILQRIDVKEGNQVTTDQVLAHIDDRMSKMSLQIANFKFNVAKEQADNDINVRYSTAAADVSKAEYIQNVAANRKVPGTTPKTEIRKLLLQYRRDVLGIEQAETDRRIAALQAQVSRAEVDAAQENLDQHLIKSPLDGVVVELYRHAGEWVRPGDPVVHVVRVDLLRVEGFLNAATTSPAEAIGQPVSARVILAQGRKAEFTGKVVFVSPIVQAGGEYQIWAAVENRKEGGQWLLRPGSNAEMTIQLKPTGGN